MQASGVTNCFWAAFLEKESKDLRKIVEDVRRNTEKWDITSAALHGYVTDWTVARMKFDLMTTQFFLKR